MKFFIASPLPILQFSRRVGIAAMVAVVSLSSGFLPLASTLVSAQAPTCTVSDKLVNSCRPWLGAAAANYTVGTGPNYFRTRIENHEARIGRQLDIVHDYVTPGNVLSADEVYMATRPNTIALINWKPTLKWATANGSNATVNGQIDAMANSIKALGNAKIMLTVFHEAQSEVSPDGDPNCPTLKYAGSSGTVTDYVNMWHNVRARFDALGVSNVVWSMNYMGYSGWNCLNKDMWPGNDYVDWLLIDQYGTTASFTDAISQPYNFYTANSDPTHDFLSKPWGLAEWGYSGTSQTQAYAFYDNAKAAVDNNVFPKLKAYVVWDSKTSNSDERVGYTWGGVADPAEQARYNTFANDPIFTNPPQPIDMTAPTVSLHDATRSLDGTTVKDSLTLSGQATDDNSLASVELLVDDASTTVLNVAADGTFSQNWDSTSVSDGQHTLQLRATDAAGNSSASALLTVTVQNQVVDPGTPDEVAPSAPQNLTATATAASQVALDWDASSDNVGVTGYNIYRDGSLLASVDGNTTAYTDATATGSNTLYSYHVTAVDAASNESASSNDADVTTPDTVAPTAPTASAELSSATTANISWQGASDNIAVAGYRVYRNGNLLASVDGNTNSYTDSSLSDATTYSYTVRAVDQSYNQSPNSNQVTVTTPDTTAPSAPTNLQIVSSSQSVTLGWNMANDNVGVTGYNIYRDGSLLASVPGSTPTYTDSGLTTNTAYQYYVVAVDAAGNTGAPSNTVTRQTLDVTAPTAPTSLAATASGSTINLTWKASTDNVGVKSYTVYRSGVAIGTAAGTTYSDSTGFQGKSYTYTVKAQDAAGNWSAASNSATLTVPDTTGPSKPINLAATGAYKSVKLTWTASTDNVGMKGYWVFRNNVKYVLLGNVTSYTNTGLKSGTTYSYKLYAVDKAGNWSAMSATVSAKAK